MHSHTLLLRLHCSPGDIRMFEKSFYLIAKMHNALVREMKKRLRMLYRDPVYKRHRHSYGRIRRLLDKKISVKLRQYCEQELKFHANVMNERVKLYGLGEHDGEKFLLPMQHKYKHYISSTQMQKEAARVYAGVQKCLYKNGTSLHFKKLRDFKTIQGKSNKNGMRFFIDAMSVTMNRHTVRINDKKLQKVLDDKEHPISREVQYRIEALQGNVQYCELVRLMFMDGWHYYVRLYIAGPAPKKLIPGTGKAGIDPGMTTMAASTPNRLFFEELAPDVKKYNAIIAGLQSGIDTSKRLSNPQNYNPDGTVKNGQHTWNYTDGCRYRQRKLAVTYRKKAAYVRQSHNTLANQIIQQASVFYIEDMNYTALARRSKNTTRSAKASTIQTKTGDKTIYKYKKKKRFGKSVQDRAPGMFLTILQTKCLQYGLQFMTIDTRSFKASQYDHTTGTYKKIPLSQRTKQIGGHTVQRDLYSSFLQQHSVRNGTHPNQKECKKDFHRFLQMQAQLVQDIHNNKKYIPNFGM